MVQLAHCVSGLSADTGTQTTHIAHESKHLSRHADFSQPLSGMVLSHQLFNQIDKISGSQVNLYTHSDATVTDWWPITTGPRSENVFDCSLSTPKHLWNSREFLTCLHSVAHLVYLVCGKEKVIARCLSPLVTVKERQMKFHATAVIAIVPDENNERASRI